MDRRRTVDAAPAMGSTLLRTGFAAMLVACAGYSSASDVPTAEDATIRSNSTGVVEGRFHTFWRDDGDASLTLGPRGYDVRWRLAAHGNMVAGVGWRRGSLDRVVRYRERRFDPGANGYLSLYGWSRHPLAEYYVVDDWGGYEPPGQGVALLGTVASDGGVYRIYRTLRTRQPSIEGTATFPQYWSVRTVRRDGRSGSEISFGNHVAAWRKAGLSLGDLDYQVVATEGYGGAGSASVDVDRR